MIKIVLCIITTDFYKEEKYILSLREDSIVLPNIDIDSYQNLDFKIKEIISETIFQDKQMSIQYVNPRFISINDNNVSKIYKDSGEVLYFLYGAIVPKLIIYPQYYWKKFDIYDQNILTELKIINDVIEHAI